MSKYTNISGFTGRERRSRTAYVTTNSEYHFHNGTCIAVRERSSGNWLLVHPAKGRKLSGSVRFNRNLEAYPTLECPRIGEGLFFGAEGPDVVTSKLLSTHRPEKAIVGSYPV